ncbi:hypothetical protein [Cohnella lupini]|uniref:Uncharacterized protein n=1 Tax=Cohnella lupini TaxID=1294267 RepID=A0A3D9HNM4_9BACL|nr:hypothetical protein [Cohnella lupini]RED51103.1 hypothetical protein DFP95_1501 [Cohnella lupini]
MKDNNAQRIKNIDVENLNIVDNDGNIKMTLFSKGNVPPPMMDGKDILPGHRQNDPVSGIIFYNGEGDECGGLLFGSEKKENGEYHSGLSITFDQYKQDQIVQMDVDDRNGEQTYGFHIYDRPNIPLPEIIEKSNIIQSMEDGPEKQNALAELYRGQHQRIFMGKNRNGDVSVRLSDSKGKERIRMVIDTNDIPRLEFLDGQGNVIYSLPPEQ